jgi:hypothetical protein
VNSWLLIRRLRGPAFVILVGINCLLHEWGILSFGRSWPLYLILGGILGLAERAAWAATPSPAYPPYPPYPPYPAYPTSTVPPTSIVPAADPYSDPGRRL